MHFLFHGDPKYQAFCAGADINEVYKIMQHHNQTSNQKLLPMFEFMQETENLFKNLPCLTFAYIH